jgi:pimeloyl-ACP methyl ester carboxylesterase
MAAATTTYQDQPFSFSELDAHTEERAKQQPVTIAASDGVELAVTIYEASSFLGKKADTALVFYHGGGAHAGAGYQILARGLSEKFGVTVYLPDLRGHGASGGPRGDAPSKEQVWSDIDTVLEFVADKHTKVFLGGHSSGGGLVLNYATAARKENDSAASKIVQGYLLVSPELGYLSGTARPDRRDFAKVNIAAFIANGIFGVLGHSRAVQFQYPKEILEADEGMVAYNTVNMANAVTPESPKEQMKTLCAKPIALWVGADDELFVPEIVVEYCPESGAIVPGKNHLGILVEIHENIGKWIKEQK